MLRFCHPERSETESKDLRTIDTAKILRFAPLTQDDRYFQLCDFAETRCEYVRLYSRTVGDAGPYILLQTVMGYAKIPSKGGITP